MPCHARQAISYIMSSHTIYPAMPTMPYHIPCHTSPGHMIYYVMPDRPFHIPQQTSPYHTQQTTYTMPHLARPIHIPCDAHEVMPYTMPCQPDHAIYHAMSARPYHIPCLARQAIPYTRHPARPHLIPSHTSPGNTIYHATA